MQKLSNTYNFGRGAKLQTRGQTRYLFIMVAVDLVKDILINAGVSYGPEAISRAIVRLAKDGLLEEIGDAAVLLVDDYLTQGNEDSLFVEPEFMKTQDLNAFLKAEKLGKGDEFSPHLRMQMMMTKKLLKKSSNMKEIRDAVKAAEAESVD